MPVKSMERKGAPKLVLVIAEYAYFRSHRLLLAQAAAGEGYEVHVVTRVPEGTVPGHGAITVHHLPIRRHAGNPVYEMSLVRGLHGIFRRIRPHIVHAVSLRLVPAAATAAALAGVPAVVNAFTGLGYLYHGRGPRAALLRALAWPALAVTARRARCWSVFQNPADREVFRQRGLLVEARTLLIPGAGVDTGEFRPSPEPAGTPVVLFAARLLRDKGIAEFVEAARKLRSAGVAARFVVVGDPDPESPASVPPDRLEAWRGEGVVEFRGARGDMPAVYAAAHVVCLPTYHEGLPKVLLEAAASGRPIVASDIPGCRMVVEPGVNGLLVPPRDAAALAAAIARLLKDPDLRASMGRRGREKVEREFAAGHINRQFLDLYERLL